jgi:ferrous iron transport protein A
MTGPILPLDQLKLGTRARIAAIDWDSLGGPEAKRLKQFGFDEGVAIEALHWGPFGKDPLQCATSVRISRFRCRQT